MPRLAARSFLLTFLLLVPRLVAAAPVSPVESAIVWVRAGREIQLPVIQQKGQTFLSVENLARLSDAQLRWQQAAKRVCLSNSNGDLCLDWEEKSAERDGHRLRGTVPMRFENDHLYVPMPFVSSKDFSVFASADLTWNPKKASLVDDPRVNLRMPQVEKVDGLYRISLDVNPVAPPQLIEQSNKQIWLRFSRAVTEGSQVYEGDTVISAVRVTQKHHATDFIVQLGENVRESDVYFDDGRRKLVIDVQPLHDVPEAVAEATAAVPAPKAPTQTAVKPASAPISPAVKPVPATKAAALPRKAEKRLPIVVSHPVPVIPVITAAPGTREPHLRATPSRSSHERIFVVDAGHGGMDCGAIGVRGTMEKDINLAVARAVAKELRKQKGVRVIMTRDRDVFVPLTQRTVIANAANADLFVSIHCNSSLSSKGRGFEAYFLSPDATDRAAAAVARVENSVVSLEAQKGSNSNKLNELLASMAVYNFLNESSKFAGIVSKSIRSRSNVESAEVKEANFSVLRGAQMPSVLLELEYLSNPVTELQLRSSRFQNQLVKGIVEGVMNYDRHYRQEREASAVQLKRDATRTR